MLATCVPYNKVLPTVIQHRLRVSTSQLTLRCISRLTDHLITSRHTNTSRTSHTTIDQERIRIVSEKRSLRGRKVKLAAKAANAIHMRARCTCAIQYVLPVSGTLHLYV